MTKKYYIITYGCQMNVHESEKLAGIMRERNYTQTDSLESADIVVLNTCCIRESATTRVLGNLGEIKVIKQNNPNLIVAVCGCMAQKDGEAEFLKKRCPFINIIFGTHNLHKFGEYLDQLKHKKTYIDVWEKEGERPENLPIYRTSGVNAWVNIMYGCNNFCTYCIVPYVRGREHSRSEELIINDVKKLVLNGYREITLLGQNVNSYGNDLEDKNINFASLLEKIATIEGEFRVKFMTSHPKDISEEVIKIIAKHNKLSNYIHLPVQAGSDRILQLMNRKYTRSDYLSKIKMIRKYIPDCGISSDIMVGFPSETEQDFKDTLDLVENVQFNNLYTFVYSRRSGTPADKMDKQIDAKTKKERITKLIKTQFDIGIAKAAESIGKNFTVLCESYKNGIGKGKTSCDKFVTFTSDKDVFNEFVNVKIIKNKNNKLCGELQEV